MHFNWQSKLFDCLTEHAMKGRLRLDHDAFLLSKQTVESWHMTVWHRLAQNACLLLKQAEGSSHRTLHSRTASPSARCISTVKVSCRVITQDAAYKTTSLRTSPDLSTNFLLTGWRLHDVMNPGRHVATQVWPLFYRMKIKMKYFSSPKDLLKGNLHQTDR